MLDPVLGFLEEVGASAIYFPVVAEEAGDNLLEVVQDVHDRPSLKTQHDLFKKAKGRLDKILAGMIERNPSLRSDELEDLRDRFRDLDRDLPPFVDKGPIPEDNDMRIMLKASKLDVNRVFMLSRDQHFLAYADVLKDQMDIHVIDGRNLPFLAQRWWADLES